MKNKLLKNRFFITTAIIACALSISACGRKSNENKDPLTGEEMTQIEESSMEMQTDLGVDYSEYDRILNESTDANDVIDYINTNIIGAGVTDIERFFSGLFNFGNNIRDIDFERLNDSKQYMPEDMIAFMDLMQLEKEKPSITMSEGENRNTINMTLSEMLERALLFEQHIVKYPNNVSTQAAARLYEEIATAAITGNYDREQGIEHYYKGDSADVIDRDSLQYYKQFAQANSDSNLGIIVNEYITVLEANDFKINEGIEEYYRSLSQKLDINTWAKSESENNTNTSTEAADVNNTSIMNNNDGINNENSLNNNNMDNTQNDTVIEGTIERTMENKGTR